MRKRKILILSITIVAVALILETCILQYVNDKNAQTTSNVLLDRVIAVIDKNEYIKIDRDKSTFKSHRDFDSEIEMTFKHF